MAGKTKVKELGDLTRPELEEKLEKVNFPIKINLTHGENGKAIVLPVSNNESFELVFKALKEGIEVHRAAENMRSVNIEIKKGDFWSCGRRHSASSKPLISGYGKTGPDWQAYTLLIWQ